MPIKKASVWCMVPALVALVVMGVQAAAQTHPPTKANFSRLINGKDGLAYLKKRGTEEPSTKPFSGVAFVEESWGRAEMTYRDGILDGEVVVVANNRLLYRFRYEQGKRVVEKASPAK